MFSGLSRYEVIKRKQQYGKNILPSSPYSFLTLLARQLKGIFNLLLFAAVVADSVVWSDEQPLVAVLEQDERISRVANLVDLLSRPRTKADEQLLVFSDQIISIRRAAAFAKVFDPLLVVSHHLLIDLRRLRVSEDDPAYLNPLVYGGEEFG